MCSANQHIMSRFKRKHYIMSAYPAIYTRCSLKPIKIQRIITHLNENRYVLRSDYFSIQVHFTVIKQRGNKYIVCSKMCRNYFTCFEYISRNSHCLRNLSLQDYFLIKTHVLLKIKEFLNLRICIF